MLPKGMSSQRELRQDGLLGGVHLSILSCCCCCCASSLLLATCGDQLARAHMFALCDETQMTFLHLLQTLRLHSKGWQPIISFAAPVLRAGDTVLRAIFDRSFTPWRLCLAGRTAVCQRAESTNGECTISPNAPASRTRCWPARTQSASRQRPGRRPEACFDKSPGYFSHSWAPADFHLSSGPEEFLRRFPAETNRGAAVNGRALHGGRGADARFSLQGYRRKRIGIGGVSRT